MSSSMPSNDGEEARRTWRSAASQTGAQLWFVHLVVSDLHEHERRLASRDRGFVHVGEPTWDEVRRRGAAFAEWTDEVVQFDTAARTAQEIADALVARLRDRSASKPRCR